MTAVNLELTLAAIWIISSRSLHCKQYHIFQWGSWSLGKWRGEFYL